LLTEIAGFIRSHDGERPVNSGRPRRDVDALDLLRRAVR